MRLLVALVLLWSTPTVAQAIYAYADIPDDFPRYVDEFVKHAPPGTLDTRRIYNSIYLYGLIGYSRERRSGVIGYCHQSPSSDLPYTIEIDYSYWKYFETGYTSKWALMLHELGHCACHREHTNSSLADLVAAVLDRIGVMHAPRGSVLRDGCPDSLMNSYAPSDACVDKHRAYYLKELYQGCRP